MTDAELELALQHWLQADASATYASDALRRRMLDIPTSTASAGAWWHRFSGIPMISASLATASVAGVLIATMFFGLFDRPAGTDGETCSNRQVQQALDNLRDAEGYRYVNVRQTHQLDPDAGLSFDDPQYVWTDGSTAEGAYLAPDRVIEHVTSTRGGLFDRGYLQHLQINDHTYRLMEVDGAEAWVEETNWPTANLVYGYIGAAFPTFSVPLVSGADWGAAAVTAELPGAGGCTAATLIPADDAVEGGSASQRAVALRVDVGGVRPTAVAIGPAEGATPREGDERSTWALTWETPDSSEFEEPIGALPDPNTVEQSFVPTPSPSPLEPEPGAWPATELSADVGANVSDVAAGDGRFVAVGAGFPDGQPAAAIWTSTDGRRWEPVVELPDVAGIGLNTVEWNGEIYLVVGHRDYVPAEGVQFTSARPETWISGDGVHWEFGGEIGPASETGEVANPGRPVFTGGRWVAGGSIWTLATNQGRPAFFVSPDGANWETIELDDVGSGSLGTLVVLPDGSLLASGCEAPGATNSGQFGEACYQRPWRSEDGDQWTPGEISDVYVGAMTRWGDHLIGIVSDADPTGQTEPTSRLATSIDGVTWEDVGGFVAGTWSPSAIDVAGDELVILGQIVNESSIFGVAWRSVDGASWETVPLGFPEGTSGVSLGGAVRTPSGLAILGGAQIGETDSLPLVWLEPPSD